jgi:hypothetical protein
VIYLLAAAAALAVGAAIAWFRRPVPRDDVERFHRARAMTTEWSRKYAATGRLELPGAAPTNERSEPAEHPAGASK